MRDLIDPALRFILGVALIVLVAMTLLKPVATPLLIDAAMPDCATPKLLNPCANTDCEGQFARRNAARIV